jgi:cytoskeleton protein RodZ
MAEKFKWVTQAMTKAGFGARLKRERELRGVSRDEICTATRIGTRFLDALENEQWGILPGGIFNRGFVRAVARFLGLDEDDLLAEYDLAMSEQNSQVEPAVSPPLPQGPARARAGRFILPATLGVIVLLGTGWLGLRWHYKSLRQATEERNRVLPGVPVAGQPHGTVSSPSEENVTGATSATPAPSARPSATETRGLELKIEAGKETSLSISADGSKVFEGSMIAGQSRTFTAQNAIDISAKDAGALLLELNGQTLAPLGPPGQPGNVTLTHNDLKPTGGGAD